MNRAIDAGPVRSSAAVRCCVLTLTQTYGEYADGDQIRCDYCNRPLVLATGAWERRSTNGD